MPVYRFANYPDTRVYSKAFIVVHAGVNWCVPMVDGLMDGGEGETFEFGKAAFQTTDWTRDDIVFRATLRVGRLDVEIPGAPAISFQACKDRNIHFMPRLLQPPP
jgi:hypothetical protein